jgi:hypothetical protein
MRGLGGRVLCRRGMPCGMWCLNSPAYLIDSYSGIASSPSAPEIHALLRYLDIPTPGGIWNIFIKVNRISISDVAYKGARPR